MLSQYAELANLVFVICHILLRSPPAVSGTVLSWDTIHGSEPQETVGCAAACAAHHMAAALAEITEAVIQTSAHAVSGCEDAVAGAGAKLQAAQLLLKNIRFFWTTIMPVMPKDRSATQDILLQTGSCWQPSSPPTWLPHHKRC